MIPSNVDGGDTSAAAAQFACEVFEHSSEAIFVTDANGVIVAANPAFDAVTGYGAAELVGCRASMLASSAAHAEPFNNIRAALEGRSTWRGEVINRRKTGEVYVGWMTVAPVRDRDGSIGRFVAILSDVTPFKAADARLRHLAHHDFLTGLANRALYEDRLDGALLRARRFSTALALLLIDLDRFKQINDALGHGAGDDILIEVAARLSACVRLTDTVARLGGDEFAVILPDLQAVGEAERVASEILSDLSRHFVVSTHSISLSASIGIAGFPHHADDQATLFRMADAAMYQVKQRGGNGFRFAQLRPKAAVRSSTDSPSSQRCAE